MKKEEDTKAAQNNRSRSRVKDDNKSSKFITNIKESNTTLKDRLNSKNATLKNNIKPVTITEAYHDTNGNSNQAKTEVYSNGTNQIEEPKKTLVQDSRMKRKVINPIEFVRPSNEKILGDYIAEILPFLDRRSKLSLISQNVILRKSVLAQILKETKHVTKANETTLKNLRDVRIFIII